MSIIVNHAQLFITAVNPQGFPKDGLPEFAFAGRSNVGKSSLINKLAGRRALARTSSSPGKTRTINFFIIEKKLLFVDLPGYGYAKTSKTEREKWGKMIEGYLKDRPQLKAIFLLVDIRHEPSENDKLMLDWCNYHGINTIVVATKSDKIKRSQLNKHIALIKKGLSLSDSRKLIPFSKESETGRDLLWTEMNQLITATIEEGL